MSNPCPEGNGTTLGTFQQFTIQCDSRLLGDTIGSQDADSFLQCVDLCSSFHPKCEGVVFNRRTCDFKGSSRRDRDSRRFDAAIADFPRATSECRQLDGTAASGNKNYSLQCGRIINGNDISQAFAPNMLDCLSQCSSTNGCVAVSFDASLDQGFKNCYMKDGSGEVLTQDGIDTAVVNNAAVAADPPPATSAAPAPIQSVAPVIPVPASTVAPIVPAPATTLTPVVPVSSSVGQALTFATLRATPSLVPASVRTETFVSVITSVRLSVTEIISTTQVMTIPVGLSTLAPLNGLDSLPTAAPQAAEAAGPTSQAWIAAPVVGSVAAVTVVAVAFVMWGRRSSRRRGGGRRPSSVGSPASPGGGGGFGAFFGRLPGFSSASRLPSEPGTPRSMSSRGGGQFWGNSWRVGRRKPSPDDADSDRSAPASRGGGVSSSSLPVSRSGPPPPAMPEMPAMESKPPGAATRPVQGSAMDGIPAFLRQ